MGNRGNIRLSKCYTKNYDHFIFLQREAPDPLFGKTALSESLYHHVTQTLGENNAEAWTVLWN